MNVAFPTDPAAFEFLARFLLSGFLIFLIRNAYVVGERPKIADIIFDIALFSLINQMVWRLLAALATALHTTAVAVSTAPQTVAAWSLGPGLAFFLEVLVLPVVIGVLTGRALTGGWLKGPYRALSVPLVDPLPRAYDHVFSQRGPGFVILSFKDGKRLFGYFGPASRAGRDPGRSEIYLERLYSVSDAGEWVETVPSRSALISLADIRTIEFLDSA